MTSAVLWIQLAGTAILILIASKYLASSADRISEGTGLGRSFIGVILLATATSLPELGTGLSSILLVEEPDLAAGDAFGSNLFNLLIIGLVDLGWRNGPVLNSVGRTPLIVAGLGAVIISVASLTMIIHHGLLGLGDRDASIDIWNVSPMSFLLVLIFIVSMYIIYLKDRNDADGLENEDDRRRYEHINLSRAFMVYGAAALTMVISAIFLAIIGEELARAMGWEMSFMGTQFLALSTSLPEMATAVAAIRLGSPELAISNVLGSNIFNMGFVLFLDDVAYKNGAIWGVVSEIHIITGLMAVLMTFVVISGMLMTSRGRLMRVWTLDGFSLTLIYIIT